MSKNINNLNKKYGNLPQNVKNMIKSKHDNISSISKESIISYLKKLPKAQLIKTLNIGTIQSIVNEEKKKKYFEKMYNDHKFEDIIRNKANMYSYKQVMSDPKKLNALSKAIGKKLYYDSASVGDHQKTEKQWINVAKRALQRNDAILNKTLNLGEWFNDNSYSRTAINLINNNNEWKKNIGNEFFMRAYNHIYRHKNNFNII